eukprot:gene10106-12395_t
MEEELENENENQINLDYYSVVTLLSLRLFINLLEYGNREHVNRLVMEFGIVNVLMLVLKFNLVVEQSKLALKGILRILKLGSKISIEMNLQRNYFADQFNSSSLSILKQMFLDYENYGNRASRKSMKDIADFVYIDAPHIVDESKGTASWWRATGDGKEYKGWETTIDYLRDIFITKGPFDGVLGFSQGAVLCSLLCSISSLNANQNNQINNNSNNSITNNNNNNNHNAYHSCFSLKFGLLFSGFQSRATIHQSLYPSSSPDTQQCNTVYPLNKIVTPSLHVWGKADELVAASNCECLSHQFSDPQCYVHEYGHLIPTSKSDLLQYRNFLLSFLRDVELE